MNHHRHHGFAMFLAVVMLSAAGLAGMALALMFRIDARRTHDTIAGAQLRQVLLAAPSLVQHRLESDPQWTGEMVATLPQPLTDAGITLTFKAMRTVDGEVRVTTVVTQADSHASQVLTYQRLDHQWRIKAIKLTRSL